MEEGVPVWIRHPELCWASAVIRKKVQEGTKLTLTVEPDDQGGKTQEIVVDTQTPVDELDVKLRNEDFPSDNDGRGGVDDLINLTHLHEPSILHVLVCFPLTAANSAACNIFHRHCGSRTIVSTPGLAPFSWPLTRSRSYQFTPRRYGSCKTRANVLDWFDVIGIPWF